MSLVPDPQLGTRKGWRWCAACGGFREPVHVHGDPLELLSRDQLLSALREVLYPTQRKVAK